MRRLALALTVACCAAVLAACGDDSSSSGSTSSSGSPSSKEPITLGFVVGKTGFMSAYDGPTVNFAKLAIRNVNDAGGVDGRPLEFFELDTKSNPATGATVAEEALAKGADVMVVSADYDQGAPAAFAAQKRDTLVFSAARSPQFGPLGIGPLAFTPGAASANDAAIAAEWAYEEKGWRTAYELLDNTLEITKTTCAAWEERWSELAPDGLAGKDIFQQTDTSIASQIARFKGLATKPDYIYLCSHPPGGASAIRQIRAAGITTPIVLPQAFDGTYWLKTVPNLSDAYVVTVDFIYGRAPDYSPDPDKNRIYAEYVDEYGELPTTSEGIVGYSMIYSLARAIREAGGSTKGPDLAAALETFEHVRVPGTDDVTYTPDVHILTKRRNAIIEIVDGKPKFVQYWMPESTPPLN